MQTVVTVHDQDLVLQSEHDGQFMYMPNLTYLFVGPRPVDRIPASVDVIVARDYVPNYEHWPQFYDFTGWYVLATNNLITSEHVLCLQYDMHAVSPTVPSMCSTMLCESSGGPLAFVAGHKAAGNFMLPVDDFEARYRAGLAVKDIDMDAWPSFNQWPSTQGMAWRVEEFVEFMCWFEPLFEEFYDSTWAGHLAERCVKAWCVDTGQAEQYAIGMVTHENRDCHGTCALLSGDRETHEIRNATFGRIGAC